MFGLLKSFFTFVVMETLELPKKWPEKLDGMSINDSLPVNDKRSTVYAAMAVIAERDIQTKAETDPNHILREFTIREAADKKLYVWRIN